MQRLIQKLLEKQNSGTRRKSYMMTTTRVMICVADDLDNDRLFDTRAAATTPLHYEFDSCVFILLHTDFFQHSFAKDHPMRGLPRTSFAEKKL